MTNQRSKREAGPRSRASGLPLRFSDGVASPLGQRFQRLRRFRGWTQPDLGGRIHLSHKRISHVENGDEKISPAALALFEAAERRAFNDGMKD